MRKNGTMYEELKLKKGNQIFKSLIHFQRVNLLIFSSISIFFVPLDVPSGELQNLFEA
jgi:hypothetical protein